MNPNATAAAADQRLTDHPEEQAVRVPLQHYMQGHASDDAQHMRKAFMPTARIESVREGPLTSWTLDTYCQRFKGTPAADEATRRRSIDAIDIAGTAASAKITLLTGSEKQEIELKPAGNKLEATGSFKVGPGTKAVAVVTIAGKAATARFSLK